MWIRALASEFEGSSLSNSPLICQRIPKPFEVEDRYAVLRICMPSTLEIGRIFPQELVLDLGFFAASGIDCCLRRKRTAKSRQRCARRAPNASASGPAPYSRPRRLQNRLRRKQKQSRKRNVGVMKQQRQQSRCEKSPELRVLLSRGSRDLAKDQITKTLTPARSGIGDGGGRSSATIAAGRGSAL